MGFKEVMGAKGNEGPNFLAGASCLSSFLKGQLDGSPQIVVRETARNSPKVLERLDMTPEEALLFLCGKRHGKRPAGVAQAHDKQLHLLSLSSDDGCCFSPVYLGILTRFKFERDKHVWLVGLLRNSGYGV